MILMKKGHVLVLKEKQPSMLIEFGPEGDAPMGYGPDTFLQRVKSSPYPSRLMTGLASQSNRIAVFLAPLGRVEGVGILSCSANWPKMRARSRSVPMDVSTCFRRKAQP